VNRILVGDDWHDPVDTAPTYESAFEGVVRSQARVLFPGYRALPFKCTVENETSSARADFALIERRYLNWWVVEVEMAHHSLQSHVAPQVVTLSTARYGPKEADYLSRQAPDLPKERIADLLRGLPPKVLVIVNRPTSKDWQLTLRPLGAELAVFEIFRSDRDRYVYRVDGFLPVAGDEVASECWLEPSMPWMLRIAAPAGLSLPADRPIEILWNGRETRWLRQAGRDMIWLVCTDRNPLSVDERYLVVQVPARVLEFRVLGRIRRG
jgi:hypothetical protein